MVTTDHNNQRTPWPFLYHGLEQEYPDSWKLYWEPGGNVYNPDPFQLSLSGPQGLRGSGGAGPRGAGGPSIPFYDQVHTKHRRHEIYGVIGSDDHVMDQKSSARAPKYYTAPNGQSFAVPENADLCGELHAGQMNRFSLGHPFRHFSLIGKAVGQGGTFDYQRGGREFDSKYTNASNFGVGVYMNGAGYSLHGTNAVAGTYSFLWSNNANSLLNRSGRKDGAMS